MTTLAHLSGEERIGIGVAVVAHTALALALAWQATREMEPVVPPERIVVSLATEVSLEATAPDPSAEPAASFAPVVSDLPQPPVPVVTPPTRPRPVPTTRPTTRPTPTPTARATTRPTPTPTRSAGGARMGENFLEGTSDADGTRGSAATTFGAAEAADLRSAITRALRTNWTAPSGVDAEQLVTVVAWRLNRDGTVAGRPTCVRQSGVTDSNRPQASVHCDRAIRAVQLANFRNLPEQFYSRWDDLEWTFDRRL